MVMGSSKHVVSRVGRELPPVSLDLALDEEEPTADWSTGEQTRSDPDTQVEQRFLLRLLDNPDDVEMRAVYADWLEDRGHARKATFLRLVSVPNADGPKLREVGLELDPSWRALVSRVPIERCGVRWQFQCPRAWDALTSIQEANVRHCTVCQRKVYFCTDLHQVRAHGRAGNCVAFCATLIRDQAQDEYDGEDILMGDISYED